MEQPSAMAAAKTAPVTTFWARRHVLAVDDELSFLTLARELLQGDGYRVTTTNYGPTTYAMILAAAPDLVIVDLVVGRRPGRDLLETLIQAPETAAIPVLVTSTDPRLLAEVAAAPDRYGAHPTLPKPFDIDELLRLVRDLIGPA